MRLARARFSACERDVELGGVYYIRIRRGFLTERDLQSADVGNANVNTTLPRASGSHRAGLKQRGKAGTCRQDHPRHRVAPRVPEPVSDRIVEGLVGAVKRGAKVTKRRAHQGTIDRWEHGFLRSAASSTLTKLP